MKRFLILLLFVAAIGIAQAQVKFHLGSPSPLRAEQNDIQKIQSSLGAMVLRSGKVILSRAEQVPQAIQEAEILSIQLFDDVYAEALQKET
ncbi:MAG: hypothetical protein LBB85_12070, partial [Dysgonamonadaceae bacterium]|nr:hypothetical protein [Dysgonamonadaceae bacterium]